jgi:hypothetical protein
MHTKKVMPKLKVELQGDGVIDNASIYLEDPQESMEYRLDPDSDILWKTEVSIPVEDMLDYSLYVLAFSGTHFTCTITNADTEEKVEFEGITGVKIKHRANIKGSKNFE